MVESPALDSVTVVPAREGDANLEQLPEGWWPRYRAAAARQLSASAMAVLEADARFIVDKALPMSADGIDPSAWPEDGVRTGMVIGSVQSGKTASMLGVASLALDRGVDIVVLLAGTRVGLWLQTYQRMLEQLDGSSFETAYQRNAARLLLPQPEDVLGVERLGPTSYLKRAQATLAVRAGRPMLIVVPKLDEHLNHLARMLSAVLGDAVLDARARPTTLLVLDDEADDASVLDSTASEKITPRFIAGLWSGSHRSSTSRHPKLRASYVAYTATPQANYLQESHNPLAPRQFSAALRVPAQAGEVDPRQLTFREPKGLLGYYCGGDLYYEQLASLPGPLARAYPSPVQEPGETSQAFAERLAQVRWDMIGSAMRHYLVAGAARLLLDRKRLSAVEGAAFSTLDDLKAALPSPHTMMFHPSARKDAHFQAAEDLARWSMSAPGGEAAIDLPEDAAGDPIVRLDPEGLKRRISLEEDKWRDCLASFEESRLALAGLPGGSYPPIGADRWNEVRSLLEEEVLPRVAMRILNSDPNADDRPAFEPMLAADEWRAPADIFTIFIAGNILSRGLTVEGLATSLFLRSSNEPAADTQMQMQRWFGYRGHYLPFCRVLLHADQLALFRQYNQRDKALKSLVIQRMAMPDEALEASTLVLEGESFVATSKVDTRKAPLSPGASPQIKLVERANERLADVNVGIARDALANGSWSEIDPDRDLGLIREQPLSLLELADLLDTFRYTRHDPCLDEELSRRWVSLQHLLSVDEPFFRPPGDAPKPYAAQPRSCPYSIAAYLRLWHAMTHGHHAPGFHATDKADLPWSQLDARESPRFYLAIRSGEHRATDAVLRDAGIGSMERALGPLDQLNTLWGSRGYGSGGYLGDQLIDYHHHKTPPIPRLQGGQTWRPRGHPGLALLHLIKDQDGGPDMVTIGLGLPDGGPDHIAALRR